MNVDMLNNAAGTLIERTAPGLHAMLEQRVLDQCPKDSRVLDIGCGTGAWLTRLRQAGFSNLSGIDIDPPTAISRDIRVRKIDLNDAHWKLDEAKFDLITMIEAFEHIENPGIVLKNIRSFLADSGTVIVTTPNLHSIVAKLKFLLKGRLRHFDENSDPTHIYPVFLSNMKKMVSRYGLEISEYWGYGFLVGTRWWIPRLVRPLTSILPEEVSGDILCMRLEIRRGTLPLLPISSHSPGSSVQGRITGESALRPNP